MSTGKTIPGATVTLNESLKTRGKNMLTRLRWIKAGWVLPLLLAVVASGLAVPQTHAGPLVLLVSDTTNDNVKRYDGTTGAFIDDFIPTGSGGLDVPQDLTIGPDGNLYVSSFFSSEVLRYDGTTGAFIDVFASAGGLSSPNGLRFGPDGNLYVSSEVSDNVLRYNGATGAFIDVFATGDGLDGPRGLTFGPDGNLYVAGRNDDDVRRYNGATGAFIDLFATGAGMDAPMGLTFGADGNLYVSSTASDNVLRFNGATGAFIDEFVGPGAGGPETVNGPQGLTFGPDGNLYVASALGGGFFPPETKDVVRFDGTTGAFIDQFVPTASGGLAFPTFMLFVPEPTTLSLLALGGLLVIRRRRTR